VAVDARSAPDGEIAEAWPQRTIALALTSGAGSSKRRAGVIATAKLNDANPSPADLLAQAPIA
jgi:hypothetical protein